MGFGAWDLVIDSDFGLRISGFHLSSWRPGELPTGQNVQMQVKDRLLGSGPAIEDGPIIAVPQLAHQLFGHQEHSSDQLGIGRLQGVKRWNHPFGDHQQMHRGGGLDVVDDNVLFILVGDLGGDLSCYDLFEKRRVNDALICRAADADCQSC